MSWQFDFSTRLRTTEDSHGLYLTATLSVAGQELVVDGYLDIGAAYCILPRLLGETLGLAVEAGEPVTLKTGGGPLQGFLHFATLLLGDLAFEDVPICVIKYPGFDRCLLGRAGWLQKVRLNLSAYDEALYLNLCA